MKWEDMSQTAKVIANVDWHDAALGESLCCLLASAYENDPDKPEDEKPDDELCGFTPWAAAQANRICQRIADEVSRVKT